MSNTLLRIHPSDLKMPFELHKQNSGLLELVNKTDQRVAFKVKTTNPRKYSVRPASGVVLPRGSCGVTITMQAPREIPPDYHCKDKFLVQSIVVEDGKTQKDIVHEMFSKEPGKLVEEFKLRVVYVPANPPSPVPEAEEEDESPDSDVDYEVDRPSSSNAASGRGHTSGSKASHDEDVCLMSKLDDQETRCAEENQKLQEELRPAGSRAALLRLRSAAHRLCHTEAHQSPRCSVSALPPTAAAAQRHAGRRVKQSSSAPRKPRRTPVHHPPPKGPRLPHEP